MYWLVVWLPFFIFPLILGLLIIPIDVHIFQRGGSTTNQYNRWFYGIIYLSIHLSILSMKNEDGLIIHTIKVGINNRWCPIFFRGFFFQPPVLQSRSSVISWPSSSASRWPPPARRNEVSAAVAACFLGKFQRQAPPTWMIFMVKTVVLGWSWMIFMVKNGGSPTNLDDLGWFSW